MYQQQQYPLVDNNTTTMYATQPFQQQQHQQQHHQHRLQSPLHPNVYQQQPKREPLPSATDAKPNITLSINEIAEFSSTMVYLMWHARRQSVMDLHSCSKVEMNMAHSNNSNNNNNTLEQTKVTADLANMTSAAFKKFCRQVSKIKGEIKQ